MQVRLTPELGQALADHDGQPLTWRFVTSWLILLSLLGATGCQDAVTSRVGDPQQQTNSAVPASEIDSNEADTSETDPARSLGFGESLEQAFAEARRRDCRVLLYFSGEFCPPCRRMEAETHRDPDVVELLSRYACVKADVEERRDLQERFQAFSIPRTLVLTANDELVAEHRGYQPLEEHVSLLQAALTDPPQLRKQQDPLPPPPVGASPEEADLLIWFVEHRPEKFDDPVWAAHTELLSFLRNMGLQPRIEHLNRPHLADQWSSAEAAGRLPDLLVVPNISGLIGQLNDEDTLCNVVSSRLNGLKWSTELGAFCNDFQGHGAIYLVLNSPHHRQARQAVSTLLGPASEGLPGPQCLASKAVQDEISQFAEEVALWFLSGNVEALQPLWDEHAPQRNLADWGQMRTRAGLEVWSEGVRLWGNEQFAAAVVETRGQGPLAESERLILDSRTMIIGSPSLVLLRRHAGHWRVLLVEMKVDSGIVEGLGDLFQYQFQSSPEENPTPVAAAQLLAPPDGAQLVGRRDDIEWKSGGESPALTLYLQASYNEEGGPPRLRVTILPPEQRQGSLRFRPHTRDPRKSGRMWTIAASGAVSFSKPHVWSWMPEPPNEQEIDEESHER